MSLAPSGYAGPWIPDNQTCEVVRKVCQATHHPPSQHTALKSSSARNSVRFVASVTKANSI